MIRLIDVYKPGSQRCGRGVRGTARRAGVIVPEGFPVADPKTGVAVWPRPAQHVGIAHLRLSFVSEPSSLPRPAPPVTVLVVEDEPQTRARLARVVAEEPRFRLLAAVATLADAEANIETHSPQVLLLDLGLPDGNGVSLIHRLRQGRHCPEILVISVMGDESSVMMAIQAGAGGYLLKDSGDSNIVAAIDQLLAGGAPLSPSIAVHLMRRLQSARGESNSPILSTKELELLKLIAKGLTYEEVAVLMGLRYNTVASYAKDLYRKLQVHSRSEAVFEAMQLGLVSGPS